MLSIDAQNLVQYLTKPCRSDVEKARAIIRWIGENIQYDHHSLKIGSRGDQSEEAVLCFRRAVCEGYANVFKHLGRYVCLCPLRVYSSTQHITLATQKTAIYSC